VYLDLRFASFCLLVYCLVALTPLARSATETAQATPGAQSTATTQQPSFPEIEKRAAAQEGLSDRDKTFLMTAAQGQMLQLELSRVATSHARNPAVRRFATATTRYINQSETRLKHVAAEFGVSLPHIVPDDVQNAQTALGKAKDIDREYLMRILGDTRSATGLYEQEAANGTNPVVAQYAQSMLPRMTQHYRNILRMSASISGPVIAAKRPPQRNSSKS
jgi:putative membrane protein